MTFIVSKRSVILSILLFNAASEAAVRGEWNTEHEPSAHLKKEESSRGGVQRQLGFILSEKSLEREWNPRQSVPQVYVHHHHHRSSSNQRKMKNDEENMAMKMDMTMEMGMMNTMAPTTRLPTRKPTKLIPTSKPTVLQMGKKGMGGMKMMTPPPITSAPITSQPGTSPPTKEPPVANLPTGEQPTLEAPTGIAPTGDVPTGDAPTGDAPTGDVPTGDSPTGVPIAGAPTVAAPAGNGLAGIGSRSNFDTSPLFRSFQNRIVGGTPAVPNEFKFIASLNVGCGGSLIAPGIILTAAHCAGNIRTARIGSNKANSGGVIKSVTTECMHPNYQSSTTTNDYLLLKLDSPVDINQYPPIQLNNNKAVPQTNQILTVIGYGATSEGGSGSNALLKVSVPANSHQQCNQQYGGSIVENVMFCAGNKSGGKDSCQGDSGGPIFEIRGGKPVQLGVVSFGEGCARPNRSGVYSRVSGAYDWIQTTMVKLNNGDTSGCRGGKPSPPTRPSGKVPTPKPVKRPTKRPSRTKRPTESPTEEPVAPVAPPTAPSSPNVPTSPVSLSSPNVPSSPSSGGVPSASSPTDDDDESGNDDDDSSWNLWSR
jgi:trypsin